MAFLNKNGRISLKSFLGGASILLVPWISHLLSSYLYQYIWFFLLLLYVILYNGALVLYSFVTTGGIRSEFYQVLLKKRIRLFMLAILILRTLIQYHTNLLLKFSVFNVTL